MSAENPEKQGINWIAILLSLLCITAGRIFWASIDGDKDGSTQEKKPYELVTAEQLGIDPSAPPVQIDVYNDGRIVVDGAPKSLDEMEALIPEWKAKKRMLSSYREPRSGGTSEDADTANRVLLGTRLAFTMRSTPQAAKQEAAPKS